MATSVGAGRAVSGSADASPSSTPARRLSLARWRDPRLVAGILLVAGSLVLGVRVVDAADDTVGVWSLRVDLPAGAAVGADDVTLTRVHFAVAGQVGRYLSAQTAPPAGVVLAHDMAAGELLSASALQPAAEAAAAELPVAVARGSLPADLAPGDRVEVWVVPGDAAGAEPSDAVKVLEDVPVLSVGATDSALSATQDVEVLIGLDAAAAETLDTTLARLANGSAVLVRLGPPAS